MKVTNLINLLEQLPKNTVIVLAKDGEGNGFSPLSACSIGMYAADSTWSGELMSEEDAKEQDVKYKENACVLWPVN